KIEKPSVDPFALLQTLQDPIRGLLREAALAGASNNDGNDSHVFIPSCSPKEQMTVDGGADRLSAQAALMFLCTRRFVRDQKSALGRRAVRCRLYHSAIVPASSSSD